MRIRSVTYFLDPGWPLVVSRLDEAGRQLEKRAPRWPSSTAKRSLRGGCPGRGKNRRRSGIPPSIISPRLGRRNYLCSGSRGMLADQTSDWVPITPRVL